MLDSKMFSVHLHLYYKNPSISLLNKIKKIWDGKVYISTVAGNEDNEYIVDYAKELFSEVVVIENRNSGDDQYGLYKSFQINQDDTKWIIYAHDKHESKIDWMNDLVDPLVNHVSDVNYLASCEDVGLMAANTDKYTHIQYTEEQLNMLADKCPDEERFKVVQSKQTLIWIRELQRILIKKNNLTQIHDPNNIIFVSGNMFIIRRNILKICHDCVLDNFFDTHYRRDGGVGHGLERFYFYATLCLNFNVKLVGENT